jgi:hypothetical protein
MATPVSLWHHHKAQSPDAPGAEKIIKATTADYSDANCSICKHHYSAFANDAVLFSQSESKIINSIQTFYSFLLLTGSAFQKPNKGPPFSA